MYKDLFQPMIGLFDNAPTNLIPVINSYKYYEKMRANIEVPMS